jgi:hypothetical protein
MSAQTPLKERIEDESAKGSGNQEGNNNSANDESAKGAANDESAKGSGNNEIAHDAAPTREEPISNERELKIFLSRAAVSLLQTRMQKQ